MAASLGSIYRNISTFRVLRASLTEPLKGGVSTENHESWKMWRSLFFLVCCPAMAVAYINVQFVEEPPRPEFKKYSHLRIRNKKYCWRDGVKTLFHNPHVNALPDGYEDELH